METTLNANLAEAARRIEIYFGSAAKRSFRGFMLHRSSSRGWRFETLMGLVASIELVLCEPGQPQQTMETCELKNNDGRTETMTQNEIESELKAASSPTFVVKIKYRRNASWQGTVEWLERSSEKKFRSALELIKLMDNALEAGDWD